ncbi:MAG: carboxy terminal-processing peptidase [Gammaproteobacteria bacterium]|nr:carboxy terminal-processing peptidase [Gammaproteobacteria bacterium]
MNKTIILTAVFALFLSCAATVQATATVVPLEELQPTREQRQATLIIIRVIDKHHYKHLQLNDDASNLIFDRYLEALDPNRSYFTARDIDRFSIYRDQLDNALLQAHLTPAFDIFRVYRQRVDERIAYALDLLERKFDFSLDEDYQFDRADAAWPVDRIALDELWRKRVKNDVLTLRLNGKTETEIKKSLSQRYQGVKRRTQQLDSNDVFQTFINAYTLSLEPHTSYMSPRVSENFDISMRLSLEGIGAVLRNENEYTEVLSTVPGGPAALSGKVQTGDRIIGVGQGGDGEIQDVVGWRLQDVVDQIRGPKGTVVRLRLLTEDAGEGGPEKEVVLTRNEIKLEDQAAKKSIIEGLDSQGLVRIGVITIPAFYRDFKGQSDGDKDFRSTTRDVRILLQELQQEKVDGIVIDLRQNGGGSLTEATELTGLFIPSGPVVQVKDSSGEVEIEKDPDPETVYAGPLAVLVDRNSASASEIFAGAIQDYHRGIIIGEPTFGKGTVQTLVDLGRFVREGGDKLGRLRLTMAQFFRVNGGSTQFRGVVPDITYPLGSSTDKYGERELDNALPWAQIDAADYRPRGAAPVGKYREIHEKRIKNDAGFKYLTEEGEYLRKLRDRSVVSLLEEKRKREWDEREVKRKEDKNRFRVAVGLPPVDVKDSASEDAEDDGLSKSESDLIDKILINEAARILSDYIGDQGHAAMIN